MKSYSARSSARRKQQVQVRSGALWAKFAIGLCLAFFALLVARSYPQQQSGRQELKVKFAPVPVNPNAHRPPLSHIYMHFLLYQNHLDRAAAREEAKGKDGSWLRDNLQNKVGLATEEFSIVRGTAQRLEPELKELGKEAMTIAKADQAARLQNPNLPRSPNPAIQDLAKSREETIQREIDEMNRDLGPAAASKLQDFIQNRFISTVPVPQNWHPRPLRHLSPPSRKQAAQP